MAFTNLVGFNQIATDRLKDLLRLPQPGAGHDEAQVALSLFPNPDESVSIIVLQRKFALLPSFTGTLHRGPSQLSHNFGWRLMVPGRLQLFREDPCLD